MEWLTTPWSTIGILAIKAVGAYAALVVYVRIAGLRSFSKMSSFDFAVTVAFGSVLAAAVLSRQPPLAQVVAALAILMVLQMLVAWARRWEVVARLVDNDPLLLMAGQDVLEDNLRSAQVTRRDLAEKLREANVTDLRQVRAVVMETTGDIAVLTGDSGGPPIDPEILMGVRDASRSDNRDGTRHPRLPSLSGAAGADDASASSTDHGEERAMTTHVILHVRGQPGTAEDLLQAVHDIGKVRAREPAFHSSQHYVDNVHPEHIIEVQTWDSVESQQAFMAKIRDEFEYVFAMLAGPPDVTFADER